MPFNPALPPCSTQVTGRIVAVVALVGILYVLSYGPVTRVYHQGVLSPRAMDWVWEFYRPLLWLSGYNDTLSEFLGTYEDFCLAR